MYAFEFQRKNIFFALIWFCFLLLVSCPEALSEKVVVVLGEDVHLKCESPGGVSVEAVNWTRPDLKKLEHVFLSVDGHIDTVYQHPSFKNRVELRDRKMKNGDLSLTLKNVKKNDSGTYECRYKPEVRYPKRNANDADDPELICTIRLQVVDPAGMDPQDHEDPDPEGPAGRRRVGVAVVFLLAVITAAAAAAAGFVIHRKQGAPGQDFNPVPSVIQT